MLMELSDPFDLPNGVKHLFKDICTSQPLINNSLIQRDVLQIEEVV